MITASDSDARTLETFVWRRVIRWRKHLHRWNWKDARRHPTGPQGRWRRGTAKGIELFNIASVPVTRVPIPRQQDPQPLALAKPRLTAEAVESRCRETGTAGSVSGLGKRTGTNPGTARLRDRDLAALRATQIGFVFQQFFLAEHQTILDNVADGLLYAGVRLGERRRRALDALALVGLQGRSHSRPTQLSGGQRQRVAIARAVVGDPAIVLADEPTGNLDQATGQSILALIDALHEQGATIIVITHDQHIAERMPRQIRMLDGHIDTDTGSPLNLAGEHPNGALQSRSQ